MVLSVPARDGEADARPVLGRILEADLKITLYPVHRLDYEVQGLIMFGKNPNAHRAGNQWFEKKEVFKTYKALSIPLDEESITKFKVGERHSWKGRVLRGKKRAYLSPHGKDSLTEAHLIKIENGIFHWELNPITGRSHQLRFDLFRHGHPIIGDELYSSNEKFLEAGIALRAFKIDFSKAKNASQFFLPEILEIKSF
ncbi:MAG: RNA pseudouridine synthase [Bdellovibrionales bacterium]|nr:RNA pseudouridine synthase [Bdellovibrionales bacterium]